MRLLVFLFAGLPCLGGAARAQSAPDLAALIECRATAQDWNALAFSLMGDPDPVAALGWSEIASNNPFLREFSLSAPVEVFGRSTRRFALGATGPLAMLDGVRPQEIAGEIGVTPIVATAGKFLGEKIVSEATEDSDGMRFTTRISLNVSTVDTHPGATLAGCSYVIEPAAIE